MLTVKLEMEGDEEVERNFARLFDMHSFESKCATEAAFSSDYSRSVGLVSTGPVREWLLNRKYAI